MRHKLLLALGVSSLTVGAFAVASPVFARSEAGAAQAAEQMAKAERELARGKTERAVLYAERAVEAAPVLVDARVLLARAYLADGRLDAAGQANRDILTLMPGDPTATLNLALIRTALGDRAEAQSLLRDAPGLSAADRGLGLVLAGDIAGGGAVLADAARGPDADGRIRQNLAFAYAMAGNWQQARVIASQDLPPASVHERIGEWAKVARPRNSWDQVAYLLNIQPVEDEGMPERLALRAVPAPVELAAADDSRSTQPIAAYSDPSESFVESEEVASAPVGPPPTPSAAVYPSLTTPSPMVAEVSAPATKPLPSSTKPPVVLASATVRAPSTRFSSGGRFVVQLGAYVSKGAAERGWVRAANRVDLSDVRALTTQITVRGRQFTRLSAGNFASRGEAMALCRSVKAKGGDCFVRQVKGDDAPRWASRAKNALALR